MCNMFFHFYLRTTYNTDVRNQDSVSLKCIATKLQSLLIMHAKHTHTQSIHIRV